MYCAAACAGIWVFANGKWQLKTDRHGLTRDQFNALQYSTLAIDPARPNILYAGQNHGWRGRSGGVSRSLDYGATWINITRNLGLWLTVWGLSVSPHNGTVYLSTDYGTWRLP